MGKLGLIGTITYDTITYESGKAFRGIGGVLYQVAVLCGLREEVFLYTNLGQELVPEVEKLTKAWPTLHREGIRTVPGPGNRVFLHYPRKGERQEVLESAVPPLDPDRIIQGLPQLDMLLLIINSGFDIELEDWRKIVGLARCPTWLDVHSLALTKKLGSRREYRPIVEWKEWARGVDYFQANRQEVASMLGCLGKLPAKKDLGQLAKTAFGIKVKAVFITLGKEGVLVLTPEASKKIGSPQTENIIDTTGCGDVFCAATASKLAKGFTPFDAAPFGILLASKAASFSGIKETFALASSQKTRA